MIRLAAFLLLALCGVAHAQMPMEPLPSGTPGPTYTGPGDVVSGAYAWYGLRPYNAAFIGSAAQNVIRTSDSHTCDLLVTATGLGNTANCNNGGDNGQSASSFCNATTCVALKSYDQTGGGHTLSQAQGVSPTLIFSCSGSLPCLTYGGSVYSTNNAVSIGTTVTLSLVFLVSSTNNNWYWGEANGNTGEPVIAGGGSANQVRVQGYNQGANAVNGTATDGAAHAVQGIPGASAVLNVDGTETTGNTGAVHTGSCVTIGSSCGAGFGSTATVKVFEAGVWQSAFTSGQRTSMCHNQDKFYSITGC